MIPNTLRPRICAAALAAPALLALLACGGGEEPAPASAASPAATVASAASPLPAAAAATPAPSPAAPAEARIHPEPVSRGDWMEVREIRHTEKSVSFSARVAAGSKLPKRPLPLIFCVPAEGDLKLRVVSRAGLDAADPKTSDTLKTIRESATIERLGLLRHWPMAAVEFKREFFDPAKTGKETLADAVDTAFEIEWSAPAELKKTPPHPDELDPATSWGRVGRAVAANPEALAYYQVATAKIDPKIQPKPVDLRKLAPGDRPWARLRVKGEGLYRLDAKKLAEAGVADAAANPAAIRLFHRGEPKPLLRRGAGAEAEVYFWNPAAESEYSAENIYWATAAAESPDPQIPPSDAALVSGAAEAPLVERLARLDRDKELLISYGEFRSTRAMRWVDSKLQEGKPLEIEIKLPGIAPASKQDAARPIRAKLNFFFLLSPLGHSPVLAEGIKAVVKAEGQPDQELTFRDDRDTLKEVAFNSKLVREGTLRFKLDLQLSERFRVSTIQATWLDWIEARYLGEPALEGGRATIIGDDDEANDGAKKTPLATSGAAADRLIALAIPSDGGAPSLNAVSAAGDSAQVVWKEAKDARVEIFDAASAPLAGAIEPAAFDDLADEGQGADYLIVAHKSFIPGVEPIAELHRKQGMRVRVVDVQSVFDQFSGGELTPYALRDFFAHTLAHWKQGAPKFVLLVGDCSNDFLDYAKKGVKNYVPTYPHDDGRDRWASDEWMALATGDLLSDFLIGRISVNNEADLKAVVEKTVNYATAYPFGPWRGRSTLVADNEPIFPRMLDEFAANNIPPAGELSRVYLGELPVIDNWYAEDAQRKRTFEIDKRWMKLGGAATVKLLDAMRAGTSLVTYFGHGSPNIWADERILFGGDSENSDLKTLRGSGLMPLVINFTCNTGAIDYPIPQWNINIIEDFARIERGGAIAALVPSGPGFSQYQEVLGNSFFKMLFREGVRGFGELATIAKARYAAAGHTDMYVYMYILLGDPALELQMTRDLREFAPPRKAYSPGETIEAKLEGIEPASGRWIATLENERGDAVWAGEPAAYAGGKIDAKAALPADAELGGAALRVYAWNEAERKDSAAAARFEIAWPECDLTTASVAIGGSKARMSVKAKNIGLLDAANVQVGLSAWDGSAKQIVRTTETLALKAGELKELVAELDLKKEYAPAEYPFFKAEIAAQKPPRDLSRPARPDIWLWPNGEKPPIMDSSWLRLRPRSIRVEPASPSEGETIKVHVVVENAGDIPTKPAKLTLFAGDPAAGGKPAYNHNQERRESKDIPVPALGPGRSVAIPLGWDESFNSGDRKFWIRLDGAEQDEASAPEDRLLAGSVKVRTRPMPYVKAVKPEASAEELAQGRMFIGAEIANDGETDAKNLVVFFYKGATPDPANLIKELEVSLVPAKQSITVRYLWEFKTQENLAGAGGEKGFNAQVGFKGSKVRFSSAPAGR